MIRYLLIILLSLFLSFNSYSSDIVQKILITGNERISNETIKLFSEIDVNSKINKIQVEKLNPYKAGAPPSETLLSTKLLSSSSTSILSFGSS